MIQNAEQADDEMSALFNTAWNNEAANIVGYVPEIRWDGNEQPTKPDQKKFWARFSIQNVLDQQITLSSCESSPGKRKYNSSGLIFIQLFCPKSTANSKTLGKKLAEIGRNAYRNVSTPNGVWFKNARIVDVAPENPCYRFNVVVEYEFDQIF